MTFEQGGKVIIEGNTSKIIVPIMGKTISYSGEKLKGENVQDLISKCEEDGSLPTLSEQVALLWAVENGLKGDGASEATAKGLQQAIQWWHEYVAFTGVYCTEEGDLWILDKPKLERRELPAHRGNVSAYTPKMHIPQLEQRLKDGDPDVRFVKRTGSPEWYQDPTYFQRDGRIVGLVGEEGAYRLACLFDSWIRAEVDKTIPQAQEERRSKLKMQLGTDLILKSEYPILCSLGTDVNSLTIGEDHSSSFSRGCSSYKVLKE